MRVNRTGGQLKLGWYQGGQYCDRIIIGRRIGSGRRLEYTRFGLISRFTLGPFYAMWVA